jgi:hypothetical protein
MKIRNMALVLAAAGFVMMFSTCEEARETRTETRTIDAEGALSASVSVHMGAGELRLSGGAASLMEAEFTTNVKHWVPETDYRVVGGKGELTVRQRKGRSFFFGHRRNDWDIRLTETLPIGLDIKLGAGESRLDLRGVDLASLEVNMGVGELNLDLSGRRTKDLKVRIHGGVGSARIMLPRDVGVQIEVDGGIGSVSAHGLVKEGHRYTNGAFGKTPAAIRMEVDAGIGSIELREE